MDPVTETETVREIFIRRLQNQVRCRICYYPYLTVIRDTHIPFLTRTTKLAGAPKLYEALAPELPLLRGLRFARRLLPD